MKRDMDLARAILLELERRPEWTGGGRGVKLELEGHTPGEISYHVMLLKEAGLVDAIGDKAIAPTEDRWKPTRLTWAGHEFLDAAREESLWQKAKAVVFEKTGGL